MLPPSDAFGTAFEQVIGVEGRYSDNPADSGGPTMFGITERLARAHGYVGDMRNMPIGVAEAIYRTDFWNVLRLDDAASVSLPIALELFDTAVNCSPARAARFLQRALNTFNRRGSDYPNMEVDGSIGAITVDALRSFITARRLNGETVLLRALNDQQGVYYMECGEANPNDEDFEFGWFLNRVH